jgi:hypothetical protein
MEPFDASKAITTRHALPAPSKNGGGGRNNGGKGRNRGGGNGGQSWSAVYDPVTGQNMVSAKAVFYAPRAVGKYEFRLYSKQWEARTLGLTAAPHADPLTVEVQGKQILEPLDFIHTRLTDNETLGSALNQLLKMLHQLRLPLDGATAETLMSTIEEGVKRGMKYSMSRWRKLQALKRNKAGGGVGKSDSMKDTDGDQLIEELALLATNSEPDEEGERDLIRWGVLNTLKVLLDSTLIMLAEEGGDGSGSGVFRVLVQGGANLASRRVRKLHSQLLHLIWLEAQEMETAEELPSKSLRGDGGGVSGRPLLEVHPFDITNSLLLPSASAVIETTAMKLMPTEEFYLVRKSLVGRLQKLLVLLPCKDYEIHIFGSSRNNFGGLKSDVDMCLLLVLNDGAKALHGLNDDVDSDDGDDEQDLSEVTAAAEAGEEPMSAEDRAERRRKRRHPKNAEDYIECLIKILADAGMVSVSDRRTARIPITMFEDPVTGLACDICLQNVLALYNTELLRTYSQVSSTSYCSHRLPYCSHRLQHWPHHS